LIEPGENNIAPFIVFSLETFVRKSFARRLRSAGALGFEAQPAFLYSVLLSTTMANTYKAALLEQMVKRFGRLEKLSGSQSLYSVGGDAVRIYVRYSKLHGEKRTFFGLREVDLRQLEGHNSFLCFLADTDAPPVFVPYADFEEIFREAHAARATASTRFNCC
jgi:hypothetical protein